MNWLQRAFVATHNRVFRLSRGRLGSRLAGIDHLLLTTTGRRSGQPREAPLACFEIDGKLLIVASNGGSDSPPAWFRNIEANPAVRVLLRDGETKRTARVASDEERARWWPQLVKDNSFYGKYEARTSRQIPIVALETTAGLR